MAFPTQSFEPLKKGDPVGKALNPDFLNGLTQAAIAGATGANMGGGPGLLVTRSSQGVIMRAKRQRRATTRQWPWQVLGDGSVVPFTISGVVPKIGTNRINGLDGVIPTLTIPGTGNYSIFVKLTFTGSLSGAGALVSSSLSTVEIDIQTAVPSDSTWVKHREFATVTDGVISVSGWDASLNARLCQTVLSQTTLLMPAL